MNDIDKARIELREHLKHLLQVIMDTQSGDPTKDKDDLRAEAEYAMDRIVDAEMIMVQNELC